MTIDTNTLLSREEAAKYLGISKGTLAVWACKKRYNLPFTKIGKLAKYKVSDLDAFTEGRKTGATNGNV